jgi:bleomycin hydrolase
MDSKKEAVGALDEKATSKILKSYEGDPSNAIIRHALSRHSITNSVYESASAPLVTPHFSLELRTLPAADQQMSGRCWIFAALNVLREGIAKKLNLAKFELSQNYISLYDKIEKANYALETIISMTGRDHDDRELSFILHNPIGDGGQWDMFADLVRKYGLLPKDAFPETYQSENTRDGDFLVTAAIRGFAAEAAHLHEEGKDDKIRPLKDETMAKIYKMFLNCFGVPPKKFDFDYEDKSGKYHADRGLTPKSFFEKYVGEEELDSYQSLINSPTKDKPFMRNYTVDYIGNVVEGRPINHLNVPMKRMKELIIKQLKAGHPVWFGSDVSFYRDRAAYAWNAESLDYMSTFGFDVKFDKADMLDYWHSAMNHAMVITGVNLVHGKPTRWKIENSWGEGSGIKGYYVMDASFFDRFVYQAVVKKEFLSEEERKAASADPIHLHPWDPMGTLAD